jgi:vitamin B12 transporter
MGDDKVKKESLERKKNAWLCAMIASAVFWQVPGISQAAEADEYALDQVVVTANRVPTKIAESAANVTVVTRSEIEKGNYQNLRQVLQKVNGVIVTGQGHPGAQHIARLNGDDRVVIMIDGRRVNMDKGAASGRAGYDLNSFPTLDNVERIEIVKGAASALYGSDAVGGVINIITRKGTEDRTTVDLGTGSWGTRNYTLTHQGTEKDWSWFLTAGKQEQDHFAYKDFVSGDTKDMPNSAYDKKNFTLRLDKEISPERSLTFHIEHAADHSGQPYMVPGRSYWGSPMHFPFDFKTSISNSWAITYNFDKQSENAGLLRVYENYYSSNFHQDDPSSYSNKAQGVDWQDTWRLDEQNLLVAGAEWRETRVDNPGNYTGRSVNNKAIYLEDRMNLAEKWTLTPGVRYDHHNMFGSKTTPRAAVNYKMDDNTNVYVSWGKVFNAPNTDDLFWPDSGSTAGNPNLKPETGNTATIGFNRKLNQSTQLTASYFHNELEDAINWAPDSSGKWKPSNVDRQRKQGMEIEIRTELSPNWSILGAYSYLKIETRSSGSSQYVNDTNNSQPNGYKVGIDYTDAIWDIGITGRGASGRSLDKFTSSSYWVWDTSVSYKLDSNTRVYMKVNNIANKDYEINGTDSNYGGPGGCPMEGRNYQLGIQLSL